MSRLRRFGYLFVGFGWGCGIWFYWTDATYATTWWGRGMITIALVIPMIDYCLASITGEEPR